MAGIKETNEALVGVNELAVFLIGRLKDGVSVGDFTALWDKLQQDAEFKSKLQQAYDGISLVPAEVSELDATEIVSLVLTQATYVPRIIEALKK
jgi:hypothetical protein